MAGEYSLLTESEAFGDYSRRWAGNPGSISCWTWMQCVFDHPDWPTGASKHYNNAVIVCILGSGATRRRDAKTNQHVW